MMIPFLIWSVYLSFGDSSKSGEAHSGNDRGSLDRSDGRNGKQDLTLPTVFDNIDDSRLELLQVLLNKTKFFDQQPLFEHKAALSIKISNSNGFVGQPLKSEQLGIGRKMSLTDR